MGQVVKILPGDPDKAVPIRRAGEQELFHGTRHPGTVKPADLVLEFGRGPIRGTPIR
jgi:hypothetical protein